ncbi:MAG: magnesium transporter [Paracoccaceae bacterium]
MPPKPLDETERQDTASSHLVTNIPRALAGASVADVMRDLRGTYYDCADTVFVIDPAERLLGLVRINDLFADGARRIGDIMEPEHEAVGLDDDQEEIASLAIRLNMIAVPVVDGDGRLVGAVPPEALFRILREEHLEDLQRLAGIAASDEGASASLEASLYDRFARRLPWLVFGLAASSVITMVMVGFEEALAENVAVAFFVPALVYVAGAIGTQAVSVSVRGLSVGEISIAKLLRDELIIGIAIGTALGLIAAGAVLAVFADGLLALAVGLAVLAGGAISAVVGFGLPWVFKRFGSDPALGSGPICTIIQDVSSLFIYFGIVTLLF